MKDKTATEVWKSLDVGNEIGDKTCECAKIHRIPKFNLRYEDDRGRNVITDGMRCRRNDLHFLSLMETY